MLENHQQQRSAPVKLTRAVAHGEPWLILLVLIFSACRKEVPSGPPSGSNQAGSMLVENNASWLFTYATPDGQFETTDKAEQVPELSRGVVRAQSPGTAPASETVATDVWVVNGAELVAHGKTEAKRVRREVFETQALALLPAGQSSILADGPSGQDAGVAEPQPPAADGKTPRVVLYGTSWCGACRTARQYFLSHNIPFVDKDVEKDQVAAAELQAKASRLGISADRVPILDVQGRLLIGFDPRRVQALLQDTI